VITMAAVVYATSDLTVAWSQGQTTLRRGDVWDADAALVKERPDLFAAEPERPAGARVERATRAPGEVRGSQRGRAGRG